MSNSQETLTRSQRNAIFVTMVSACIGLALLSTALNTALPVLVLDLGISAALGQWVTSGYALALAIMMPLTAFFATRFATRPLYLLALALFVVGTVMSALAPGFELLMVSRLIQGCGNALISAITQVSIMTMFPEQDRGRAMGWFGLATSTAPIIAPAMGGLIVDLWGWRYIFWIIAVMCSASFIAALFAMKNVLETAPKVFDVPSFILSVLSFGGLTVGIGNIVALGIGSPVVLGLLALGAVTGVLFAHRQLTMPQPFLKLSVLRIRDCSFATILSMLVYFIMMGMATVTALYVQSELGHAAFAAGAIVIPGGILSAFISPVAGTLFDKHGIRPLVAVAGALLFVSTVGMCVPVLNQSMISITVLYTMRCFAFGFVMMTLTTWGNNCVETSDMAHVSAVLTSFRNLAGALGIAVLVGVLDFGGIAASYGLMAGISAIVLASVLLIPRKN